MIEHPDASMLEQFVQGELTGPALARLEAHVVDCEACAASLAREARLEAALFELASAPTAPALGNRRPHVPPRAAVMATLAAAAAVVLGVQISRTPRVEPSVRSIPGVICAVQAEQATCVQRAHQDGLWVAFPDSAGPPPLGQLTHSRSRAETSIQSPAGPSSPPLATTELAEL